jgi:hypothetical protein
LPAGEYTFSVSKEEQSPSLHTIQLSLNEGQHSRVSVRLDSVE